MDKIIIKGLKLFGYHGVNFIEKQKGQTFEIDLTMYADISVPCESDLVGDTVNYANVNKTIQKIFLRKKFNLLEKCCEVIAQKIFEEYPKVQKIDLTIKKPDAPMNADFDYVAVNIVRERKEVPCQ